MTKAEMLDKIEAEIMKGFALLNERNWQRMERDGCSQEEIDLVKRKNDALVWPAIQHVALAVLGVNLAEGPQSDGPLVKCADQVMRSQSHGAVSLLSMSLNVGAVRKTGWQCDTIRRPGRRGRVDRRFTLPMARDHTPSGSATSCFSQGFCQQARRFRYRDECGDKRRHRTKKSICDNYL